MSDSVFFTDPGTWVPPSPRERAEKATTEKRRAELLRATELEGDARAVRTLALMVEPAWPLGGFAARRLRRVSARLEFRASVLRYPEVASLVSILGAHLGALALILKADPSFLSPKKGTTHGR